ncbi:hypothetical protein ACF06V_34635 [Streptomyces bobili]|uniref:hypothetical protein n=1 Tax=Streptomyces bobili TaxID=67280 RepID=UPI00370280C5
MSSRDTIQYAPDVGLLMIPGDPAKDHSRGFAVFDDSVPALRAFILDRLRKENIRPAAPKAKDGAVIPVRVGLVPRPDNDYDTRAVSVAAPPCHGGSVLDRHMGYLYSSALHVMSESIRELTEETGMPVGCHGWIELYDLENDSRFYDDEDDADWEPSRDEPVSWAEQKAFGYAVGSVRVLLPERQTVRALVDAYLAARRQEAGRCTEKGPAPAGVEQGLRRALAERLAVRLRTGLSHRAAGGAWGRETERDRARQRRDAEAQPLLHAWETYRSSPHGFRDLRAVTRSVFHHTRILVLDRSGVEVGQYHEPDGPLTLVDERVRAEALDALRAHGVDVDAPEDLASLDGFPDAVVVAGGDKWSIRLCKPGVPRSRLPETGWFDPDSGTLTVYAASLAEPLTVLLLRHGVRPLLVTWGTPHTVKLTLAA